MPAELISARSTGRCRAFNNIIDLQAFLLVAVYLSFVIFSWLRSDPSSFSVVIKSQTRLHFMDKTEAIQGGYKPFFFFCLSLLLTILNFCFVIHTQSVAGRQIQYRTYSITHPLFSPYNLISSGLYQVTKWYHV